MGVGILYATFRAPNFTRRYQHFKPNMTCHMTLTCYFQQSLPSHIHNLCQIIPDSFINVCQTSMAALHAQLSTLLHYNKTVGGGAMYPVGDAH